MKFTVDWLKDHLDTKKNDNELIEKLTDVGLEVESIDLRNNTELASQCLGFIR